MYLTLDLKTRESQINNAGGGKAGALVQLMTMRRCTTNTHTRAHTRARTRACTHRHTHRALLQLMAMRRCTTNTHARAYTQTHIPCALATNDRAQVHDKHTHARAHTDKHTVRSYN